MDNKTVKNAFFSESIKLEYFHNKFSIKQLIQEKLIKAIFLYQKQFLDVDCFQQISTLLSEKIILSSFKDHNKRLVYRCAISFFLANIHQLSPLSVANQLVTLLKYQSKQIAGKEHFEVAIYVTKPGWIDFYISDRAMTIWLNQLITEIEINDFSTQKSLATTGKIIDKLFPLQYIYGRCFSLLNLGISKKIITLKANKLNIETNNLLKESYTINSPEKDLIRQICLIIDYIALDKAGDVEYWSKFTRNLSEVWLKFVANCQFYDNPQQNSIEASDRLKLIFVTQYCIQKILVSEFGITPHREI